MQWCGDTGRDISESYSLWLFWILLCGDWLENKGRIYSLNSGDGGKNKDKYIKKNKVNMLEEERWYYKLPDNWNCL